jgi:acyl dehydratase
VSEATARQIGTVATFTKQVSEADIALFELVTRDENQPTEEPAAPVRKPRQAAPYALLAAFLASAVARHAPDPGTARFSSQAIQFAAPAYTDDTLSAVAELAAYDAASRTLRIRATCENQDGMRLADGEFALLDE